MVHLSSELNIIQFKNANCCNHVKVSKPSKYPRQLVDINHHIIFCRRIAGWLMSSIYGIPEQPEGRDLKSSYISQVTVTWFE